MEDLPYDIVSHIFSFLSISDRFRLRRVSRDYKLMTEFHMKNVKRLTSERRESVYSPLHAGCGFGDQDVCPAAARPAPLIHILTHCSSIQCLFIGKIPAESDKLLGQEFDFWNVFHERGAIEIERYTTTRSKISELMECDDCEMEKVWDSESFGKVVQLLQRMDDLQCLSWIRLQFRLPDLLLKKLRHAFCPTIYVVWIMNRYANANDDTTRCKTFEVRDKEKNANLQETDYSDVILTGGRLMFVERHQIGTDVDLMRRVVCWHVSFRCPAGEEAFDIVYMNVYNGRGHYRSRGPRSETCEYT